MKILTTSGNAKYRLMLVGHGPMKEQVEAEAKALGLSDSVLFLDSRSDIPQLMTAMDIFCMPSLFEGFPIVSVEAQATGLPVLISSNVSKEVCITDLVKLLPISQGDQCWVEHLKHFHPRNEKRTEYSAVVRKEGYDIRVSAGMLSEMYYS